MLKCSPKTQCGKGNEDILIERGSKAIAAAGKLSDQPDEHVGEHLKHYLLQDEVDALISDAIIPEPKQISYRHRKSFTAGELINPPSKTTHDLTPFLPVGFDFHNETFGIKTVCSESAYGLISPKNTPIGLTNPSLEPGYQIDRHYFRPPYDPNETFGIIYRPDRRGTYAKCCVSDDRVLLGPAFYSPRNDLETDIKFGTVAQTGHSLTPNDNIKCVPNGYAFGKLIPSTGNVLNCLTTCPINSGREFFLKCLAHLNTVRKCLSIRFDDQFFRNFYLQLKYLDKANTGWLPKDIIYNFCSVRNIRVNSTLIEPLLDMWNGFDGSQIQYRIFVDTINFRKPSPDIPKIPEVGVECLEFSTTYNDMVRPGQEVDHRHMAGLPSARYIDEDELSTPTGMCKADGFCLPEESDVRSCVTPSNFTLFGVTHRDMYAKRSPEVVRRVFEAAGAKFTDKMFNELWDEAKKYHSQGWVSYETFRKVLGMK